MLRQRGLQLREVGAPLLIQDDGLTIDYGGARLKAGQSGGDRREASGPVVAVAGAYHGLAGGKVGGDAVAVPLDLVHPLRADRRLVDERR